MRLLRSVAIGLLAAAGACCVGFVAWRIGHELYPWAGAVTWVLFLGLIVFSCAIGSFYGHFSTDAKVRSFVLAIAFIVTLTGFYAVAVKVVDEHHNNAFREQQERWQTWVNVIQEDDIQADRCEWFLLEERFESTGQINLEDVAITDHYCSTWGRNVENVPSPIYEFWAAYEEQGGYPTRKEAGKDG